MGAEIDMPVADHEPLSLRHSVRSAVIWRSGSQIVAQTVSWLATFLVIRLLDPADYGLFAMTQVVLALLTLLNGYSFASHLVQAPTIDRAKTAQVFGMLILLNFGLAACQVALAPLAAAYYRHPIVADLLRVQALLYLATPFIALPNALLSRAMDFRRQAVVNLCSAVAAALTALACAETGCGVWTLVAAPIALFWTRAIGMTIAARLLIWPSFRFAGAGATVGFGGTLILSQIFWFVQTQCDVVVAGRSLDPHHVGLYTTGLFLSQILVAKFLPALNEVAFPAYARIQHDRGAVAANFVRSVRLVMLVAMPFGFGLAVAAEPLVLAVLGRKWAEVVPVVRLMALVVPLMALHTLYTPATNALGRPGVSTRISLAGAILMPLSYLIGVRYGPVGMAASWLVAAPALVAVSTRLSLPVIGARGSELAAAIRPALLAALAMAGGVVCLDRLLPIASPLIRLALLVAAGGGIYMSALLMFARTAVDELFGLLLGRRQAV